jgi:2-phosphosulfolactate phosphatase
LARTVVIDAFPESADKYRNEYATVVVDVIRATTTAVTAVAQGRRCFPVPSLEAALPVAARLDQPLLVGELGGNMPYGFDVTNSPAEMAMRTDVWRSMILLSSSGTQLMARAAQGNFAYVGCLRNMSALVKHLAGRHTRVAVLGAGTRGEFREEDQACCAWIAEGLMQRGFAPHDASTVEVMQRWSGKPADAWKDSRSVEYLRRTHQIKDFEFVVEHVDDLDTVFMLSRDEVVPVVPSEVSAEWEAASAAAAEEGEE